jgi:hypothetical protein
MVRRPSPFPLGFRETLSEIRDPCCVCRLLRIWNTRKTYGELIFGELVSFLPHNIVKVGALQGSSDSRIEYSLPLSKKVSNFHLIGYSTPSTDFQDEVELFWNW